MEILTRRDIVTPTSIFSGIADALRAKGVSGTMTPAQMPDNLAGVFGVTPSYTADNTTLEGVFTNMATSIRACGYSGTITAIDMPAIVDDLWPTYNITWNLHNSAATAPSKTTFDGSELPYTPPNLSSTTNNPWHNESAYNWTKNVKRVLTFSGWTPANIPVGTAEDVTFDASWSTKYTFSNPTSGGGEQLSSSMYLFNYIPVGNYKLSVNNLTFTHTENGRTSTGCVIVRIVNSGQSSWLSTAAPLRSHYTVSSGTTPTNRSFTINNTSMTVAGWSFSVSQAITVNFSLTDVPISITTANSRIALGTFENPNDGKCTLSHSGTSTTATLTKV